MNAKLKQAGRRLLAETKYSTLGVDFGRFLCVVGIFTVAAQLSTSFFNIFLLRATGSPIAMMRYNLLLACIQPPAMLVAVQLVRRSSLALCLRAGLMLHVFAYLILTVDGGSSESMVYGISVMFSIGNGFYYTSNTPLFLAYTDEQNRDTAQGATGTLAITGQLMLPLLTGLFITAFGDLTGYRILFALSALVLFVSVMLSYRMRPVGRPQKCRRSLTRAARIMRENRQMRDVMVVSALNSVMVSGTAYYVSLLMYAILEKESVIGLLSTIGAVISLVATLAYSRYVSTRNRGVIMFLGAAVSILGTLVVFFHPTVWGYTVYALLYAAANYFLNYPAVTAYMSVLEKDTRLGDLNAEVHALREFFVTGGRAIALVPAFFLRDPVSTAAPMLLVLALLQIPAALIVISLNRGGTNYAPGGRGRLLRRFL